MNLSFNLLDHGYLTLIESWGTDARIVESARMSTDGAFRGWERHTEWICDKCKYTRVNDADPAVGSNIPTCPTCSQPMRWDKPTSHPGDLRLLTYLYKNWHHTPFEMCGMTIEVQAPIFVFRQWHRHRTQSYNELSARYTEMPDLAYVPTVERILQVNAEAENKQAKGSGVVITQSVAENDRFMIEESNKMQFALYRSLLSHGMAGEVARTVLPVGQYSRMRASANLRNWLHFLTLRMDPHAQWETRQYANAVGAVVATQFPRTWKLFIDGDKGI